ncbi:non-ribosomal peptide synthase/polyketide synthase [Aquimarina rhabdastrellae]
MKDITKLHIAQQDIYYHQLVSPESSLYNVGGYMVFRGDFQKEVFKEVIENLPYIFDSLTIKYDFTNDEPVCFLDSPQKVEVIERDFSQKDKSEIEQWVQNEFNISFDLYNDRLYRYEILKITEDEYWVFACFHHLITDGYGFMIISDYVINQYKAILHKKEIQENNFGSYFTTIKESLGYFESDNYKKDSLYWNEKYKTIPKSVFTPKELNQRTSGGRISVTIPNQNRLQLEAFAGQTQSNLQQLTIAALAIYFGKTENELEEISIGIPVHKRGNRKERQTFGVFSGIIPFKTNYNENMLIKEFIQHIKHEQRKDYRYRKYPLGHLNRDLRLLSQQREQLFDIIVNYEPFKFPEPIEGLKIETKHLASTMEFNAPLSLRWCDYGENQQLELKVDYDGKYFTENEVKTIYKSVLHILNEITATQDVRLKEIEVITQEEKNSVVKEFNQTYRAIDYKNNTLLTAFNKSVVTSPDGTAIVFQEETFTYAAIEQQSNQLANYLINLGVQHKELIPICLSRGPKMLVSILAILKVGGAYVPIDPNYPQDRIDFIVDDTNATYIITEKESQKAFLEQQNRRVVILDKKAIEIEKQPTERPSVKITPEQLAYIIYTSGTTGTPKGVMIAHRSIYNFIEAMKLGLRVNELIKVLSFTNYTFDISLLEFFLPLCNGGTLVVVDDEMGMDPMALAQYINKIHPTHIQATPSRWKMLLESGWKSEENITLLTGGEATTEALKGQLISATQGKVYNVYGPTEATVWATIQELQKDNKVNIGKPIANTQTYILNKQLEPQPIGVAGELCIGGIQVAEGYLNRSELTGEKFIPNPFKLNERIYRTGDLAKWVPNGEIEFIGRKDNQIKLRGYRIELGEIEATLEHIETVQQAVVLAKDDHQGSKRLVAYVITEDEVINIQQELELHLPEYMVPKIYLKMGNFPLMPSGKVNRKALPEPDFHHSHNIDYKQPITDIEQQLVAIWEQVLQVDQIGMNDNFFELGGHSIIAVRLVNMVRKKMRVQIKVQDIFETRTVAKLATRIENAERVETQEIKAIADKPTKLPLSFTQERLWFIDQLQGSVAYHIPGVQYIEGALDVEKLQKAIASVVQKHEVLHTVYKSEKGLPYQTKISPLDFVVDHIEIEENKVDSYIQKSIKEPFDLANDYMLRAEILQVQKDVFYLVIVMHHIASDGWSLPIVINEIQQTYAQNEDTNTLPIQYADYSIWQRETVTTQELDEQLKYWEQQLTHNTPLQLPTDYQRPVVQDLAGAQYRFSLNKEITKGLKSLSKENEATLFMTMMSLYKVVLHRYTGESDITVGTPVANRPYAELSDLIGFFVNTIAIRSQLESDLTFTQVLTQTKTTTLEAYQYQEVPFEKIVERVASERDQSRTPIFQTMLMLQNTEALAPAQFSETKNTLLKKYHTQTSKFDLSMEITEANEQLEIVLEYSTALFKPETIARFATHFMNLAAAVLVSADQNINTLELLPSLEKDTLLNVFNTHEEIEITHDTVLDLFEKQVTSQPEATALLHEDTTYSYQELATKSNQLANYLIEVGVENGALVPICMDRSLEMVVTIFAVLKTGAAYIPIDPKYPQNRIDFILKDTAATTVITTAEYQALFKNQQTVTTVTLDTIEEKVKQQSLTKPQRIVTPEQLAYIIYTSGTTGTPKGVMIQHRSLMALLYGMDKAYPVTKEDRLLLKTTFTFDVSVYELFGWIYQGASLGILTKGGETELPVLIQTLASQKITHFNLVPSLFAVFIEALQQQEKIDLEHLKYVMLAGERLPLELIIAYRKLGLKASLENIYGPTEATIYSSYFDTSSVVETAVNIPIGKPFATTSLYVLNDKNEAQPIGVKGELCIGGTQVAKGYWNRPDLTADKFIENPFKAGDRLYKTGDVVRWLPNGIIEYLGRKDNQVKLRGYRIELGEIEATLDRLEVIKQSVVMVKQDALLVAYITPEAEYDTAFVEAKLRESLPAYMIPNHFITMEAFPLNPSGKIDRKRLPEPQDLAASDEIVTPTNKTEEELVRIWQTLLQKEAISTQANFFEIGGHSLLAVRMLTAIQDVFQVTLSVKDLFQYTTITQLAAYVAQQETGTKVTDISIAERPELIPLSFTQERLWFLDHLKGSTEYHVQGGLKLTGDLNSKALEKAFKEVVQRHESLRTVFEEIEGQPYQKVKEASSFELAHISIQEEKLASAIEAYIAKPFDLSSDDMLRATLFETAPHEYTLIIVAHHIASDGWSIPIIVKELEANYDAAIHYTPIDLPKLAVQYIDYSLWQRENLTEAFLEEKLIYWEQQLQGTTPLAIPTDHIRPAIQNTKGAQFHFEIDTATTKALHQISQEQQATLFMTLMSIYKIVLYRYANEGDITVGSPIANRMQAEIAGLVGFFVNMVAIRDQIEGDDTFESILAKVKQTTLEAYEHQEVPFEKIVDRVITTRDQSKTPIFQTILSLQNNESVSNIKLGESQAELMTFDTKTSKYDLSLDITENERGLAVAIEYSTALYNEATIARLATHFKNTIDAIVTTPNATINTLELLSEAEKLQLQNFNTTKIEYPEGISILDMFQKQVIAQPKATAIVFEGTTLSFEALDQKTNQLANYLNDQGVTKETLVPICVERSFDMIVGILAILKAGGAYVPIDPTFPADRIEYILGDIEATFVLTQKRFETIFEQEINSIVLDHFEYEIYDTTFEVESIQPEQLAYVIYTSGTTGKPKGVLCEHKGLYNRLLWMRDDLEITQNDIILQKTTYTFDVSVWELTMPLIVGCQMVLAKPEGHKDPLYLQELIATSQGTIMHFVPSMLSIFLEEVNTDLCTSLRHVVCSGEALTASMVKSFRTQLPNVQLHNLYGPTEAAIDVTAIDLTHQAIANTVSIGYPVANTQIYIVNPAMQEQPVGVAGELCIGGIQVARGYLKREELNQEKFINNPFVHGGKLYRTGDLASWNADGSIAYVGRIDNQIKLRGYRIELGEIEALLEEQEAIQQAVVVAKEVTENNKQLVAYVVTEGTFNKEATITILANQLPEYMVPKYYVALDEMPLSVNGKVDRKKLPNPAVDTIELQEYIAPKGAIEEKLAELWNEVLGTTKVSSNANFFEIGGHSLLAVKLVSRIRKQFEKNINVKDIFQYATIATQATFLEGRSSETTTVITKADRTQKIPLSFTQERLWFIDNLQGSQAYHIPAILQLKGNLDTNALINAIQALITRHESLRTVYKEENGIGYQQLQEASNFEVIQDNQEPSEAVIQEIVSKPFDLSKDYMLRAVLLKENETVHQLVLVLHHIAADGWSLPIFVKELQVFYEAAINNQEPVINDLPIQYADYSVWQRNNSKEIDFTEKLAYWETQLLNTTPLALATDYSRPAILGNEGNEIKFTISSEITKKLQEFSQKQGTTLFMTLLTAYKTLLYRYTNEGDITVGSPIANREQAEVENLIGFFVNTIALRTQIESNHTFIQILEATKATTLDAYAHQEIPFEKIVDKVAIQRDQSRSPIFQTMFTLQNNEQATITNLGATEVTINAPKSQTAKFELSLSAIEQDKALEFYLEYNTALFKEATMVQFAEHFETIVSAILAEPTKAIAKIPLLTSAEEKTIASFNATAIPYPEGISILDMFKKQVAVQPKATAIVFDGQTLSFSELDRKTNQLAHKLKELGVKQETLVPICVERSFEMIIGIVAILKAGGAYVPIDPTFPMDRISYMLEDTAATLVLTQERFAKIFDTIAVEILALDALQLATYPETFEIATIAPEQLAYVIYTSGTTGKPKGVLCEHQGLYNRLLWMRDDLDINQESIILQKTTYTFDVSVWELTMPLIVGCKMVFALPEGHKDPEYLQELIQQEQGSIMHFVPSMLSVFLEDIDAEKCKTLQHVICSGEALTSSMVRSFREHLPWVKLHNLYGPTEAAIDVTAIDVTTIDVEKHVSIGYPVANTQIYILNETLQSQPIGVAGELCIGGIQVARGYLNREDLTADKFIENPFVKGERLYKTGDLASWERDGSITYIGRKDNQVKIRGYRIELGEIETLLDQLDTVSQSVVIAKADPNGNKQLIGYVVSEAQFDEKEAQTILAATLPEYMVPKHYVTLDKMPLSVNGKVDRKQLPEPDFGTIQQTYIAPNTAVEKQLVAIWQELLRIDKIGITANFFELGGDSIKAIQLVSKAKKQDILFKVKDVFTHQTIAELAQNLRTSASILTEEGIVEGVSGLLPIQSWFFEKQYAKQNHFNQSVLLELKKEVTIREIDTALQQLIAQHDALRFRYEISDETIIQTYQKEKEVTIVTETITSLDEVEKLCERYQESLDISKGELFRSVHIQAPEKQLLYLVIHHLAVDGVSWRILLEDLQNSLNGKTLDPKQTSYRQWQEQLQVFASSERLVAEQRYWETVLEKEINIAAEVEHKQQATYQEVKTVELTLDTILTRSLQQEIHKAYTTDINDILLSALAMTLSQWQHRNEWVVAMEGHGREELSETVDISRTVGWFTSLYPVALSTKEATVEAIIANTKDALRAIPNKGIGYGILKYLNEGTKENSLWNKNIEEIVFNYLGDFDGLVNEDVFAISKMNKGNDISLKNQYASAFVINSIISEEQLHLSWNYDSLRYDEATVQELVANYVGNLKTIIAHCTAIENTVETSADYGLPVISHDVLQQFKQSISAHQIEDIYPLNPLQEGLLFHSLYENNTKAYVTQFSCDFDGIIDEANFRESWKHIFEKHSVLRTQIFPDTFQSAIQCVYKEVAIPIEIVDQTEMSIATSKIQTQAFIETDRKKGFDITAVPLIRITLVRQPAQKTTMIVTNHHILWDGWSFSRIMSGFINTYETLQLGKSIPAFEVDHYGQQVRYTLDKDIYEGKTFWKNYLQDLEEPTYVPFIKDTTLRNHEIGNQEEHWDLGIELSTQLEDFAQQNHLTVNTLIQGAWGYLLSQYTRQETISFGATISGRDAAIEGIDEKVGLYINTIPVCITVDNKATIADWLQTLQKEHTIGREEYSHLPLQTIQQTTAIQEALFDTLMVFENYPIDEKSFNTGNALAVENLQYHEQTNYTLSIAFSIATTGLQIKMLYNDKVLDKETVATIGNHLINTLQSFIRENSTFETINYLSKAEQQEILYGFNTFSKPIATQQSVLELFKEQVIARPDAIALVFENQQLTYKELDEKTAIWASYLLEQGLQKEELVPVFIERSLEMCIAVLAIIKAGGAYVPIDVTYPQDRINFILEDTSANFVITQNELQQRFENNSVTTITVESIPETQSATALPQIEGTQLLYVIYTSGTTGKPKGVLCEHQSMVNLALNHIEAVNINETSTTLQFASVAFDAFGFEIYPVIASGGKLVVTTEETIKSIEGLSTLLKEHKVTNTFLPPSYQTALKDHLSTLETIVSGGEALQVDTARYLQQQGIRMINAYGPTESTICSSMSDDPIAADGAITIGKPLDNVPTYILDANRQPVPVGVVGELCLGGIQTTRGYLNRPELSEEKFINNPFISGERLYRTGDLAKWYPDGSIAYIGRIDHQVKLRGYRIELGEIETAIERIAAIEQAVVLVKEDQHQNKRLVAYITKKSEITHTEIETILAQELPSYMVPKTYVVLELFPLTSNGKIDRKHLPEPQESDLKTETYIAPSNDKEVILSKIWEELLGVKPIGITHNFFELGGDSIKAIQLVSRAKNEGIIFKVKDIFQYQTIQELVKHLRTSASVLNEAGVLEGEVGLMPIQQWFFEREYKQANQYNQSTLLTVDKTITAAQLKAVVAYLNTYHDALRLQYEHLDQKVTQTYGNTELELEVLTVQEEHEIATICESYQEKLSYETGSLAKFVWMQTPDTSDANRLFIVIHHLAIDGVSWRILIEDIQTLITQFENQQELALPNKQTSYRQWQQKLTMYATEANVLAEVEYWKGIVANTVTLPQDIAYHGVTTYRDTLGVSTTLNTALTQRLLQEVHQAYSTEINDILLSALTMTLTEWMQQNEVVIALEGHGREDLFDDVDISRTLGWFTNLYPVQLKKHEGEDELKHIIANTKEMLRAIPNKGIGYGVLRYLTNDEVLKATLNADFERIVFNYLGSFDTTLAAESKLGAATENVGHEIARDNQNPHRLTINSMVVKGELQIHWNYDALRFEESTITQLAAKFEEALEQLIIHCTAIETTIATASDYGLKAVSQGKLEAFKQQENHQATLQDIYPLSPLQEGILFHSMYDTTSSAYLVQFACDLIGTIDRQLFVDSWAYLVKKHSILRTKLYPNALGQPVQCVYDQIEIPIEEKDFSAFTGDTLTEKVNEFIEADHTRGIAIDQAPLIRITLLNLGEHRTRMVITNHHIILDGWSFSSILSSFMQLYTSKIEGNAWPEIVVDQYGDHVRQILKKGNHKGEAFWKTYTEKIEEPTYIPFIKDTALRNKVIGNTIEDEYIASNISEAVIAKAQEYKVTVNTMLQAAWSYIMAQYTQQDAVSFGATISGRDNAIQGIEERVGLYINTIPVCTEIRAEATIENWLQELQEGHTTGREEYSHIPLGKIQRNAGFSDSLFDTLLVFENYPVDEETLNEQAIIEIENITNDEQTNYVLTAAFFLTEGQLKIKFLYNDEVIAPETVAMIKEHFLTTLETLTQVKNVGALKYMSATEQEYILEELVTTTALDYKEASVIELFQKQVERQPDAIALTFEGKQLTYKELDQRSNQLAQYLIQQGVTKEELIPVCVERSLEMVIAVLGIIKAGGAYVPLDPSYPKDRIEFILQDTSARYVLTQTSLTNHFEATNAQQIVIDEVSDVLAQFDSEVTCSQIEAKQLIYVIYTSGTTGKPKGVLCEHGGMVNYVYNHIEKVGLTAESATLQFATVAFDAFGLELYPALSSGGKLVITTEEKIKAIDKISQVLKEEKVTHALIPPSYQVLLKEEMKVLETVISGGEALQIGLTKELQASGLRVVNAYGPTESTICCTMATEPIYSETTATIGSPLHNVNAYVMDDNLQLVAKGVVGELCVGGVQVARGYLNRPELTAEKFVQNPYKPEERLYRTGDLVRWLDNGTFEYLGRKDNQIKLRGYRIELGEIENAIEQLPTIQQAVVDVKIDATGEKRLVAYVIGTQEIDQAQIETALQEELPVYMIPRIYVAMETFKLTHNGKIDRKQLPEPEINTLKTSEYKAAETETEKRLVALWEELLKITPIGINDNFFELGGHSLLAVRLIAAIREEFELDLDIKQLFNYTTIQTLAQFIEVMNVQQQNIEEIDDEEEEEVFFF